MKKVNSFGMYIRNLRLEKGIMLKEMADALGVSSSFLSAVEHGKKEVPDRWEQEITYLYKLNSSEEEKLIKAIDESKYFLKMNLLDTSNEAKDVALSFARKLDSLNMDEIDEIKRILSRRKKMNG